MKREKQIKLQDRGVVVTDEQVVKACTPMLRSAQKDWGTVFLSAYQIWALLLERDDPICKDLKRAHGGKVGTGAGRPYTPVVRIAHTLSRSEKIEHHYVDGRFTKFMIAGKDVGTGYPIYNIFRLR